MSKIHEKYEKIHENSFYVLAGSSQVRVNCGSNINAQYTRLYHALWLSRRNIKTNTKTSRAASLCLTYTKSQYTALRYCICSSPMHSAAAPCSSAFSSFRKINIRVTRGGRDRIVSPSYRYPQARTQKTATQPKNTHTVCKCARR